MDGYTLTEKMRKARRSFRFTAVEQALFYELVAICNGEDWRDIFDCSNIELCCALSISEKTLVKARETLINAGLFYYKSGKSKRAVCSYSFIKPLRTTVNIPVDSTTDEGANVTANKGANSTANPSDYIKTKTKTKNSLSPTRAREGHAAGDLFPDSDVFEKSLEECFAELKANQSWKETFCMNIRIRDKTFMPADFDQYLQSFFRKLANEGETKKAPKDAMSHFARWLDIELKNKKDGKANQKGSDTASGEPVKVRSISIP